MCRHVPLPDVPGFAPGTSWLPGEINIQELGCYHHGLAV